MKTIYHLAISRLKYNKGRSLLTIVAITLMTTLLMSIGSSALTVIRHQQLEIAENARNYHAAFKGTTTDQIFILENHTDVESLSTRESVASIELPKLNAFLNFDSIRKGSIDQIQLADGKMPAEVDEIAGPPALFERLGVVPKIGQRFQLPLRIQGGKVENFDFTITGILEQADISKLNVNETRLVYGAFVSEKFVEQHIAPEDRAYTAYIRIVNENKHSKDEIETIISEIAEDVGLNKSDISFNEQYLTYMTNPGTQERNVMIGLGLVVVFLGGMVIYSIYYVSVISNIQEMGKLKALGATKKHIRRLLFTESLAQSFIGIPCGILLGYLATVFLFRMVILSDSTLEDTFWHWQAAICVIVVVLLTVCISADKQNLFQSERVIIGKCPRCSENVYEGKKNFYCGNRSCQFVMWKNDRFFEQRKKAFTPKIAAALLKNGKAKVKGLYSEKTGKTYDATVLLADTGGKYVNYRVERKE